MPQVPRAHDPLSAAQARAALASDAPLPGRAPPAAHARHAHHRSTRRALRAALYVTLAVLGLVLLLGWVYTTALRARLTAYAERISIQDDALGQLKHELAQLRAERDALASGRLPGLIPLEYDRALALERGYVRNVIFTETGTSGAHRYEYRIVFENTATTVLRPAVRLLFFDDRGLQIGESDVERDATGAPAGLAAWLQPGETRSYTAVVALEQEAVPSYFLLIVE
jgi:cell division protein FtsB